MSTEVLVSYPEFAALRLVDFACSQPAVAVHEVTDWIFMGRRWVGEGIGAFTDFLRPEERPQELGAITLELVCLPRPIQESIFAKLRLPIRIHATESTLIGQFGQPRHIQRFVDDRRTLEFDVGRRWPYLVSCTVQEEHGLIYVAVVRQDMLITEEDERG